MRPEQCIQNVLTSRRLNQSSILGLLALMAMSFAEAQTWTGGGDGTSWNDGSNWNNGVVPNSVTAVVNFNPPGSVTKINLQGGIFTVDALNLSSGFVLRNGTLNMSENSPGITYTGNLNGTAPDLAVDLSLVLNLRLFPGTTINVADGAILTIAGDVSGPSALLNKTNAGTLRLTGTNSYRNLTVVEAGTLEIGGGSAMDNSTSVDLRNSARLRLLDNEQINRVTGSSATRIDLGDNVLTLGRNLSGGFSFFGTISGSGGLTKVGTDAMGLWGTNTYTGTTTVEEGNLSLESSGQLAETTAVVVNGGRFSINGNKAIGSLEGAGGTVALFSGSLTTGDEVDTIFAGQITGAGSLVKRGAGTFTLSGNSNYTGETAISAGTLNIDGSLGNTDVSVASDATIAGTGAISGSVTVADGGGVAPGNSPGTLTIGALALNSNSVLNYELGAPGVIGNNINDLVEVNGALLLDGQLDVTGLAGFAEGSYRIFNYTGGLTDNGLQPGGLSTDLDARIDTSSTGQVNLEVFVLEPAVSLSTTSIDFGTALARDDASFATVTVTNTGTDDLVISEITDPAEPFGITGGSCTTVPVTVAVDESCEVEVRFGGTGITAGQALSSFDILSDAPSSPDTIMLSGSITPRVVPALNRYGLLLMVLMIGGLAWCIGRPASG